MHPTFKTYRRALVRSLFGALVACLLAAALLPGGNDASGAPLAPSSAWASPLLAPSALSIAPGDAAAIQPAIDRVFNEGGGVVHLPAAMYSITRKIGMRSNVALVGDGMDRTVIRWDPSPSTVIDNMLSNNNSSGNSNFQVRDLTLDGAGRSSATDASCCYGVRFRNVAGAYVINVAADGHSKDGFYLGYVQNNGALRGVTDTRLSGCRARSNGRNGISITHGSGNVVDSCRVEDNNRSEAVAGIDLEPDEGLSVTNSKLVANSVVRQNVGIQLYVKYNGYAQVGNNAVCYNSTSGNGTGLYDFKGTSNIYVENQHADPNPATYYDTTPRFGPQYAGSCQLGALPPLPGSNPPPTPTPAPTTPPTATAPPTSTPIPTPRPTCQPRPPVTVATQRGAPGQLLVTLTANIGPGAPNNRLRELQFGQVDNGTIEVGGQVRAGSFAVALPPNTQQATIVIRRAAPGVATTVGIGVIDDCGTWNTFAGGGPSAF